MTRPIEVFLNASEESFSNILSRKTNLVIFRLGILTQSKFVLGVSRSFLWDVGFLWKDTNRSYICYRRSILHTSTDETNSVVFSRKYDSRMLYEYEQLQSLDTPIAISKFDLFRLLFLLDERILRYFKKNLQQQKTLVKQATALFCSAQWKFAHRFTYVRCE